MVKKEENTQKKAMSRSAEAKLRAKEQETRDKRHDKIKLALAILILIGGVVGYHSAPENWSEYVKALIPIISGVIAVAIVLFWCAFGRRLLVFIRESTQELGKVVRPDRRTTTQMTIVVIIFVAMLALFMALADSLVSWILFDHLLSRG